MSRTDVVTCFLRYDGRILLLRRSGDVGSYPGRWTGVAGHLAPARGEPDDDPETTARRAIREETGRTDAVLVRRGEPFAVTDADHAWRVHPLLFEVDDRTVEPNRETGEYEWVHATEIRRRDTVPDLWGSYDRVRPTVASVRDDHDHGSAWLSLRALEVLRDVAGLSATGGPGRDLPALARDLAGVRPSMTALENRISRVMATASERTDGEPDPGTVERAAAETLDAAATADGAAAAVAADLIDGRRVCTLSHSGTVLAALRAGDPAAVLIAESRPGREGVAVAETLAAEADVTLTSDAALAGRIAAWDADAVLLGADTVLPDGSVVNKVGSRAAALSAAREGIDCYAAAATDKVSPDDAVPVAAAPESLYEGSAPLATDSPLFETVPADLLDGVATEAGVLDAPGVADVAAAHRQRRGW